MKKAPPIHSKLDLMTHPVRLRILLSLTGSERTSQQIAAALPDIPASSIYRHLQMLLEAGLVEVVAERRVRGAVEKTLRVVRGAASIGPDEVAQLSPDDHRRMFLVFLTELFQQFDQYLARPDIDMARDMLGFRTIVFHATDAEWRTAMAAMNAALIPLLSNESGGERKARRLASIALLAPDEPEENKS